MEHGFFLITGTSRGIGEALALKLTTEGHTVLGVSRSQSQALTSPNYHHHLFNLTETDRIGEVIEHAAELVNEQNYDFLCLVSNASAVEPMDVAEKCAPDKIQSHIEIGLISPMILTSQFMQQFADAPMRKKIALVSSGAYNNPLWGHSVYCAAKAGISMYAQVVGLEQGETGFEVLSIGPGMVDTGMQAALRKKTKDQVALVDIFNQAYADGTLDTPADVAEKIYKILDGKFEQGRFVDVSEVGV